jgi:hypothetical protein
MVAIHQPVQAVIDQLVEDHPVSCANVGYRLHRAGVLVQQGHVRQTNDDDVFIVISQTHEATSYRVNTADRTCTCPDAAKGNVCKHRIAAFIFRQLYIEPTERFREEHKQVIKSQRQAYEAFLQEHEAPNITFTNFTGYPNLGTVAYMHPSIGINNVEVIATKPFFYPAFRMEVVQVIALRDLPFIDGDYPHYHATLPAYLFTPAGASEPYRPAVNLEEIQFEREHDRHERRS